MFWRVFTKLTGLYLLVLDFLCPLLSWILNGAWMSFLTMTFPGCVLSKSLSKSRWVNMQQIFCNPLSLLTSSYSLHTLWETLNWAFFWAGLGTDLSFEHRSNRGRMPFLTPPMTLMGFKPTTHWPWAASTIHWATACLNMKYNFFVIFDNRNNE